MIARALLGAVLLAVSAAPAARAAVDLPPPAVTGAAGEDGWFVGPVTVKWSPTGENHTEGCDTALIAADTAGVTLTCRATDSGGGEVSRAVVVKVDQTPPAGVAATPARPPDAPPFYTAPVAIAWSATDATSGVAACTLATYAGPDAPAAAPQGACRDRAGNVSAPLALTFAYDATAPPLGDVAATAIKDDKITLAWTTSADAQAVSVTRDPGGVLVLNRAPAATTRALADGPLAPATTYTYTVTVRDAAGHATSASASATTPARTAASSARTTAKAAKRPTLRWKARRGARYYNLQLFRGGRKVLSAWPRTNHYTLKARWRFRGRTRTLGAGRYRFYVWPGYGPRAAHRYGRLIRSATVTVAK